jgi:hypothetical protein
MGSAQMAAASCEPYSGNRIHELLQPGTLWTDSNGRHLTRSSQPTVSHGNGRDGLFVVDDTNLANVKAYGGLACMPVGSGPITSFIYNSDIYETDKTVNIDSWTIAASRTSRVSTRSGGLTSAGLRLTAEPAPPATTIAFLAVASTIKARPLKTWHLGCRQREVDWNHLVGNSIHGNASTGLRKGTWGNQQYRGLKWYRHYDGR